MLPFVIITYHKENHIVSILNCKICIEIYIVVIKKENFVIIIIICIFSKFYLTVLIYLLLLQIPTNTTNTY